MTNGLAKDWPAMSVQEAHKQMTAAGAPFEMAEANVNGHVMRVYKNAPPNIRTVFELTRAYGDREFIIYEDERITYEDQFRAVAKLANVLTEQFGVTKGDRIAIVMRNFPEWSVAFWAAAVLGCIATPLNAWGTGEELEYGFNDSGAKVGIVDEQRAKILEPHLGALKAESILVARSTGDLTGKCHSLDALIGPAKDYGNLPADTPLPDVEIEPDDDLTIFYTSGTTGKPKGALGTHRNVVTNLMSSGIAPTRASLMRGEGIPVPDPTAPPRVSLISVPLFHATGCYSILVPTLAGGHKLVFMYRWDAGKALELIETEQISAFGGVPAMAIQVLEHPKFNEYDLSTVESVSYGGAPAPAELPRRLKEAFPLVEPGQGYGMTETTAITTTSSGAEYVARPESCGVPVPICDLKVCDEDGNALPSGELGELWIYGPNVVKEYFGKPEETAKTFRDGWVVTGDIARIDEDGYLYILDRAKDMLIRGGENIYCVEVENILYDHPRVMDAAIVGIPHPVLGEEVGAVVQITPGDPVSVEELKAHVAKHLANFKVPIHIDMRADPLPRNPNGKILKRQLREEVIGQVG